MPFLFWKDPREKDIFTIRNPQVSKMDMPDLSQEGFLIFPFNKTEGGFKFSGIISRIAKMDESYRVTKSGETNTITNADSYKDLVCHAVERIKKGFIQKVVLARSSTLNLNSSFDLSHFFEELCKFHPNALVYCLKVDQDIWIGATPEVFIQKENETYITHALAGTVEQSITKSFGSKEIEEQYLVKNYIVDVLVNNKVWNLDISKDYELSTGKLKHIINEIRFCSNDILKIISELHPTPAVCGTPLTASYDYITLNEKLDREFYSGFLGPIYAAQNFSFWVNLRCAKMYQDLITLYAGAGIVKNSNADDEWYETELKMNSLREYL